MKLYKAKLYILNPKIPYFSLHEIEKNATECNVKISQNETIYIGLKKQVFLESETIFVRKRFLFKIEDIETGLVFPRFYIKNEYSKEKYKIVKTNQRVYVHLEEELKPLEVKEIYEKCSTEYILEKKNKLEKIIEEQDQYCDSIPKTNRQYVKLLRKMRK